MNPGTESKNATYLEFSLICVFHLKATDLMLGPEQTTGTLPMNASAMLLARQTSGMTFSSLYARSAGRNERISSERSGAPVSRIMARV